jgi:hypothetical protein
VAEGHGHPLVYDKGNDIEDQASLVFDNEMLWSILAWYESSTDRFRSLPDGLRWGYERLLSILVILFLLRTQVCSLFYMGVSYIHLQAAHLTSHLATFGDPRPHCL